MPRRDCNRSCFDTGSSRCPFPGSTARREWEFLLSGSSTLVAAIGKCWQGSGFDMSLELGRTARFCVTLRGGRLDQRTLQRVMSAPDKQARTCRSFFSEREFFGSVALKSRRTALVPSSCLSHDRRKSKRFALSGRSFARLPGSLG